VTITQAEYVCHSPKPIATPSEFVYDVNFRLNDVKLSSDPWDAWKFADGEPDFDDPYLYGETKNEFMYVDRKVECLPATATLSDNHKPGVSSVTFTVKKRSRDTAVKSVSQSSACGDPTGMLTVIANNEYATVYGPDGQSNPDNGSELSFRTPHLNYGSNWISYSVLPQQAYNESFENMREKHAYNFPRYIPFSQVAYWVRDKALGISFNKEDPEDKAFFESFAWKFSEFKWYEGGALKSTGRNYNVTAGAADYSLVISGTCSDATNKVCENAKPYTFATCSERGEMPHQNILTPVLGQSAKLIASSFGARLVPGGMNLVLNTPEGGKITIYTVDGQLVSSISAVDARTAVKLPAVHKMYIVKLEAK
jgi:hypothetical protein